MCLFFVQNSQWRRMRLKLQDKDCIFTNWCCLLLQLEDFIVAVTRCVQNSWSHIDQNDQIEHQIKTTAASAIRYQSPNENDVVNRDTTSSAMEEERRYRTDISISWNSRLQYQYWTWKGFISSTEQVIRICTSSIQKSCRIIPKCTSWCGLDSDYRGGRVVSLNLGRKPTVFYLRTNHPRTASDGEKWRTIPLTVCLCSSGREITSENTTHRRQQICSEGNTTCPRLLFFFISVMRKC